MAKGGRFKKRTEITAYPLDGPLTVVWRGIEVTGNVGDWCVTGIDGRPYLISDDVFRKTYEPLDEEAERLLGGGK